jgi:RNA methyltransferase, TrmH family
MSIISSRANPKIKALRSLRLRKTRDETGLFLVEGIRHVGEAVEAGAEIQAIYYAPDILDSPFALNLIKLQEQHAIPCYSLTTEAFSVLASKENPQGIIAEVRQTRLKLEDLSPQNFPWGVAVVSPQDPGNLGAILRTIDAVGASGLLVFEGGVDPYHPSSIRASMGTLFHLKVLSASFDAFAGWSARHGYHVYGSSAQAELDYRMQREFSRPRILLLGSEREGLTQDQAAICEQVVRLPMSGRATSLNLAVAAGVLMYAMLDQ